MSSNSDVEKGIEELVNHWPGDGPELDVLGSGPLEAALRGLRFERPWTGERAAEWWSTHVAGDEYEAGTIDGEWKEAEGREAVRPEREEAERAA